MIPRRCAAMSIERERSYGGVVVHDGNVLVIAPAGRPEVTTLPKGRGQPGESDEQTAAREVREETGVNARIVERLGTVEYWYRRSGLRVFKTVGYYLCDYVSGDTADHDDEVDEARWMPLERAQTELSFPGERRIIARALSKQRGDR
jgi:8-oxo-dGTP pyrophosphatase MutT (NUDIX family)